MSLIPFRQIMQALSSLRRPGSARALLLTATVPLIVTVAGLSVLVAVEARRLSEREIAELETQLIEAKKRELKNYLALARTAIARDYNPALPDDRVAQERVKQTLAAMVYGSDGFIFVYDYTGTNLVAPRETRLINRNWAGLRDIEETPVVDELIDLARAGGGYHSYLWTKPSTGETERMVSYVIGLQDWQWAVGTGIFIDDVLEAVSAARAETEQRIRATFGWIAAITIGALWAVFLVGVVIVMRDRRRADRKLKALTLRIFDTQEEERGRVARELHDSISQMLVGVRYALELARRRLASGDARAADNLDRGVANLSAAITEVRRISRDLRPSVLDDLGIGPALQALTEEFEQRTGIHTEFETVVFSNRLAPEAKTAFYRIAQEALTNIERHAEATVVKLSVFGHKKGATMRISDNGKGMEASGGRGAGSRGLGLRNMHERLERLDGRLTVTSSAEGTLIEATVPLTRLLAPDTDNGRRRSRAPGTSDTASPIPPAEGPRP